MPVRYSVQRTHFSYGIAKEIVQIVYTTSIMVLQKIMRLTFSILNAPVNLKTFTGITSVIVRIFNTQRNLDSACDFLYNYKTLTVNGNITYVSFKKSESELFTGDSPRTIIHQENVYL